MKLSAPLHVLKQRAKENKRAQSTPLNAALNDIAKAEGFASWSLLQSKAKNYIPKTAEDILDYLNPGDLLLIGARPGLGKTTLALELLLRGRKQDRACFFFSFEYTHAEIERKLSSLDGDFAVGDPRLSLDFSDDICADYILRETAGQVEEGSLIAIDYLQLLDQQRQKPSLQSQVETLKEYAKSTRCIVIFISQIDRRFDQSTGQAPGPGDIRLPNPLDLGLFNKKIFVQGDEVFL